MRRARLLQLGLAVGAAAALTLAVVPAATADTDTVTITGVTVPSQGVVAISTTSTTSLTTLNVTLTSAANPNALSLSISDFTLSAGSDTAGTWTLTAPITDATLPNFGTYTIDVSAADSGGGAATDNSGSLPWVLQPAITLNASQTTFTYDSQPITFSGSVTGVNPDGSTAAASELANLPLSLAETADSKTQSITTDSTGNYSATVSQPASGAAYSVSFQATSTTAAATSPQVTVNAAQDPAEVTANVSATQLNYGQQLTISGTADYNPGSGFVPLANSNVAIYAAPYDGTTPPIATVPADAQGNYTYSFADHGPGTFYVYAGGLPGDTYLDSLLAQAEATTSAVNVAMPVKITSVKASLNPFAVLTIKGCLTAGATGTPPALPLRVEWAYKTSGPWHVLKTESGLGSTACGSAPVTGRPFTYRVPVAVPSAYYRLSFAGSLNDEPANSAAVHESKILTKITGFNVSPRTTAVNRDVTVTGRLWKHTNGAWHAFAGQKIWILVRYQGSWYYYGHHPVTSSTGRFSGRFQLHFSGPWVAEYLGGTSYFASATGLITVHASGAAAAAASLRTSALQRDTSAGSVLADTGLRLAS